MPNDKLIEAILFFRAEPVSIKEIAKILNTESLLLESDIIILGASLSGRGINLVRNGDELSLATASGASEIIEQMRKEELSRDLGKAGLETVSIILYLGPISRVDIDYIRGVNSNFILRNLLIRGLVERVNNPNDNRSFLYKASTELMNFMGLVDINSLPEYETVRKQIESWKKDKEENKSN